MSLAGLGLGALLGAAFCAGLRVNARLYLAPGRLVASTALHAARIAAAAAALTSVARLAPTALPAALAGFTAAALVVARRAAVAEVGP